ncbi:alpha/beta hydrolase [Azospirillum doebereinerae]|uniref:alpha/beta hydrolase n=1 Tax=Azospirillum doebereinerae TaxID=92933 RepID=UPI001EE5BA47|nr:alpha/beta hydrolase [Azospirillum doebereinerae]MCG5242173.1 alpha/beta hydrolase [Azospirillum doebereinerae]
MTDPVYDWLRLPDGTRLRTARLSSLGAARGTVLLLAGRAEFIEKYTETAEAFVARGFQVVTFDWRNQGLSDRPLANRQIHHLTDFATLVDDLDAVHDALVAPLAKPVVLAAHSMGALVALLALARHAGEPGGRPGRYAAAILSAPMFEIHTRGLPRPLVAWLAAYGCACGWAERYAFGQHDYDPAEGIFRADNTITSDPARYAAFHGPYAARPELRVGGVSFGWVAAALRAADRLRALPLERVTTPVLLLSAPGDRIVRADAHRAVARRLGNATLAEHPEAKHELLMERDSIRDRVWQDIDAFLAACPEIPERAAVDGVA